MNFVTPWTAACQASLSITNSWSLLKLLSIESVMTSNHLILCCPLLLLLSIFPVSGSFLMSGLFISGGQNIEVSASASVLPMNIQDWFPLGWTGWISLQSKRHSRVFSNSTVEVSIKLWEKGGFWWRRGWSGVGSFWTVVLEKTVENPLDCKEIQPIHPKGDQSWIFIRRTHVEAETPILWTPDEKN